MLLVSISHNHHDWVMRLYAEQKTGNIDLDLRSTWVPFFYSLIFYIPQKKKQLIAVWKKTHLVCRGVYFFYLCHPIYPASPISHLCSPLFQLWVRKVTTADISSQTGIWGESSGAHLHPSAPLCTADEPLPASWQLSGGYRWIRHSCCFSHSPLSTLPCLPHLPLIRSGFNL